MTYWWVANNSYTLVCHKSWGVSLPCMAVWPMVIRGICEVWDSRVCVDWTGSQDSTCQCHHKIWPEDFPRSEKIKTTKKSQTGEFPAVQWVKDWIRRSQVSYSHLDNRCSESTAISPEPDGLWYLAPYKDNKDQMLGLFLPWIHKVYHGYIFSCWCFLKLQVLWTVWTCGRNMILIQVTVTGTQTHLDLLWHQEFLVNLVTRQQN